MTNTIMNRSLPKIIYPEELPVSAKRETIAQAINSHQVIIVAGETGSGKTTQLPKICLELGRGKKGMIGHTQPRRIAAISVAKRIAQELQTELGDWVGYQIRFADRTGPNSVIKLMTDGILLAETQSDPLLKRYDTIIIDEAHERSLNIDFLLGLLKNILEKRPDLKVIITSATIDAQRFAQHFKNKQGKAAKVIEVSGRLYPVTIRYRPITNLDEDAEDTPEKEYFDRDDEKELVNAIRKGVDECCQHGEGDILVFLPGEREIRESADALKRHNPSRLEILPLFARMSQNDQDRIFRPSSKVRRVILATNVAETSLTVPGIRYVVDSGLARVKRYSWRNKVEQLLIEPISQAAANQRAGRCGRLGPGLCIRLYDEPDFNRREQYTDPEILRSSLASVILQMKALKLRNIENFPFVDKPTGRAIADGYHILQELGALNRANNLNKTGYELAKLPLDPKIARMILSAKDQQALTEILIIAAVLSIQDPRERPYDAIEASQQAHAKFKDKDSEFNSYLKLWAWYQDQVKHKASQRKLNALLKKSFLSPRRLREWYDIYVQLKTLVSERGWRLNKAPATYEQLHKSLLSGLLGNIGLKSEEQASYQGARGIQFFIHPGSTLRRGAGKWIVAAELVKTSRLFARTIAKVDPRWIEQMGKHLIKKSWSDPQFDQKRGQVLINERGTVYGLQVYHGRKVHYGRIDLPKAREMFIREALVYGLIARDFKFIKHNLSLLEEIELMEHQSRRLDILVDETEVFKFYDQLLPEEICQTASFEHWFKQLSTEQKNQFFLDKEDLMQRQADEVSVQLFPKKIHNNDLIFNLSYHFEPGSPKDGVTMTIPVYLLNQVDENEVQWLVPGMLKEKIELLIRSLPQGLRRACVPIPDYANQFYHRYLNTDYQKQPLLDVLIMDLKRYKNSFVKKEQFKVDNLPAHLFMSFKVVDKKRVMLSAGRNLSQLKAEYETQAQDDFQTVMVHDKEITHLLEQKNIHTWDFGDLPNKIFLKKGQQSITAYPALIDQNTHCDLEVFDDETVAQKRHLQGLIRLFTLDLKQQISFFVKELKQFKTLTLLFRELGTTEDLKEHLITATIKQTALSKGLIYTQKDYNNHLKNAKRNFGPLLIELSQLTEQILTEWTKTKQDILTIQNHALAYEDIQSTLDFLMQADFISYSEEHLKHYPRYLKALQLRIKKIHANVVRDYQLMQELHQLINKFNQLKKKYKSQNTTFFTDTEWLFQELRVALFAQELKTPQPISIKRLEKKIEQFKG